MNKNKHDKVAGYVWFS